jgi:hypothetical protein
LTKAKHGFQASRADPFNQRLNPAAVLDERRNGANFQAVLLGKQLQVWQARHGAVVVHDLADHGCRRAACDRGEITAGLGVACAHQHAAIHRLKRKNMARLHQVFGAGLWGNCGEHRARPVGR